MVAKILFCFSQEIGVTASMTLANLLPQHHSSARLIRKETVNYGYQRAACGASGVVL